MIPNSWFQLGIECQALFSPDSKCRIPFDDNFSNGHLWEISFKMLDFMWKMAQENRAFEIRNSLTNASYDAIWYVEITIWTTSYLKYVFALLWNMSWKNFLIFNHLIFVILSNLVLYKRWKGFRRSFGCFFRFFGELLVGKTRCKRIFHDQMNSGVATHILKWSFMIWETFQRVLAAKIKGERKLDIWLTRLRKQWCTFRCTSLWLIST